MRSSLAVRAVGYPRLRALSRAHGGHSHSHGHSHDDRAGGELRSQGHLPPLSGLESPSGPRGPLPIGLELARAVTNLGRALESHAQALVSPYADTFESVWYGGGLLWRRGAGGGWAATRADDELRALRTRQTMPVSRPAVLSLSFGDDRTALVKALGADGKERFLSMLRLDGLDYRAHDGWTVVREVVTADGPPPVSDGITELQQAARRYLRIEHGGGTADAEDASRLFSDRASLLAVGSATPGETASPWSAPAGALLEVSLREYLASVASQTAHTPASAAHDAILAIDLLPCQSAAALTVRVGNGAQDRLFTDHLLVARGTGEAAGWKILSKTFAPRPWPERDA